jgi:hypothetical protein
MSPEYKFLNKRRIPARLYIEEAAIFLGVKTHDLEIPAVREIIPPLILEKNAVKYWARADLEAVWHDRRKLMRISHAICAHWKNENHGSDDQISLAE